MTKPADKLEWIPDNTTNIEEPTGAKKNSGFVAEKPPFQFHNWIFNIASQWINYLSGNAKYNVIISDDSLEADYATLAAYLADAPAAGDRVLLKNSEVLTTNASIPAGILLSQEKGQTLTTTTNFSPIMTLADGVVLEGSFYLGSSDTGTTAKGVSVNGDGCQVDNLIVENTSTGTITNAFYIESGKLTNTIKGQSDNSGGGAITNAITDNSGNATNDYVIRDGTVVILQGNLKGNVLEPSSGVGVDIDGFLIKDGFGHRQDDTTVGYGYNAGINSSMGFITAIGHGALEDNTTGQNVAVGQSSTSNNTTGTNHVAVGTFSLQAMLSNNSCTAIGNSSLNDATGGGNTGLGASSGDNITVGINNTCMGYLSGGTLSTGSNNTYIGYSAYPTSSSVSNEFTLGNSSIATLRCQQTTITALSDKRDKANIEELTLGLDLINAVRPVTWNWDKREWYEDGVSDGSKREDKVSYGFIAQELDKTQTGLDAEWLDLVLKNNPEKLEATPGKLLFPLIKAVQELSAEVNRLKAQIND